MFSHRAMRKSEGTFIPKITKIAQIRTKKMFFVTRPTMDLKTIFLRRFIELCTLRRDNKNSRIPHRPKFDEIAKKVKRQIVQRQTREKYFQQQHFEDETQIGIPERDRQRHTYGNRRQCRRFDAESRKGK